MYDDPRQCGEIGMMYNVYQGMTCCKYITNHMTFKLVKKVNSECDQITKEKVT